MDRVALNFGFSSCPNDTFAFHALVHGLVPGPPIEPVIASLRRLVLAKTGEQASQARGEAHEVHG